jgi:uncharacterized Ntn-hydrolase superfamily protein
VTSSLAALVLGTFSVVAADPATGQLGVAVESKFPAVGAIVPAGRAGVGAVATQALANVAWRDEALRLLAEGLAPDEVLKRLVEADPQRDDRQIGLVDAKGRSASFTGSRCFDHASSITGEGFAVQGNILAGRAVVEAVAKAYQQARAAGLPLAERLLAALEAGQAAGGDRRGQESAALLVVKPGGGYGGSGDVWVDLRVDDHPRPIVELRRLYSGVHQYYFGETRSTVKLEGRTAREVKEALARTGFLKPAGAAPPAPAAPVPAAPPSSPPPSSPPPFAATPDWDAASQQALEDFMGWENLEARIRRDGTVDTLVLEHLRKVARAKRP